MQLGIGTPEKNISAIIDTGSEAMIVQCGSQSEPAFDPGVSTTYRKVACATPLCQMIQQSASSSASRQQCSNSSAAFNTSCTYSLSYGDSRNSTGDFSQDTVTLNSTGGGGRQVQFKDVPFGCAHSGQDFLVDLNSLGILGFDRGNLSFMYQLGGKFSYCFPSAAWQPRSTGVVFLGDSGVSPSKFGYTSLVDNPVSPARSQLYYVNLEYISVGGKTLPISESAFKINQVSGDGGTVLDSGTVFTRLVDEAYTPLRAAFESLNSSSLRTKVSPVSGFDTCYNLSAGSDLPDVPEVSLHFAGDVKVELRFENLFVPVSVANNEVTVCMALLSSEKTGFGKLNVIGNFQQSNYLVEYDNQRFRVGFCRADCSASWIISAYPMLPLLLLLLLVLNLLL